MRAGDGHTNAEGTQRVRAWIADTTLTLEMRIPATHVCARRPARSIPELKSVEHLAMLFAALVQVRAHACLVLGLCL